MHSHSGCHNNDDDDDDCDGCGGDGNNDNDANSNFIITAGVPRTTGIAWQYRPPRS